MATSSRLSPDSIAWAAGLFEGEGCFYLGKRRSPMVSLDMTDEDVVSQFATIIGFGSVRGPLAPRGTGSRKPYWHWGTQRFEYVQALVAMFWPWLGTRRKKKAIEVLIGSHSMRQERKLYRCHPDESYNGNGWCKRCYHREYARLGHAPLPRQTLPKTP